FFVPSNLRVFSPRADRLAGPQFIRFLGRSPDADRAGFSTNGVDGQALELRYRPLTRHQVDAIGGGAWRFAEELDPGSLHARVVPCRFRKGQERLQAFLEASPQG